MKLDIRDVHTRWINLDGETKNKAEMESQFDALGIKTHRRKSAVVIEPPKGTPDTIKHYRGCAQSHIDILDDPELRYPLLILEDDAKSTPEFEPVIEIPDDTDAIYLGVSQGSGHYYAEDIGGGFARISGVFATHAILYLTESYAKAVSATAKDFVYNRNTPFDLGCAALQGRFKVITPHKPFFYQADARSSANKWENLTRGSLRIQSLSDGTMPQDPLMIQ
jgi:hypothetical protein